MSRSKSYSPEGHGMCCQLVERSSRFQGLLDLCAMWHFSHLFKQLVSRSGDKGSLDVQQSGWTNFQPHDERADSSNLIYFVYVVQCNFSYLIRGSVPEVCSTNLFLHLVSQISSYLLFYSNANVSNFRVLLALKFLLGIRSSMFYLWHFISL